MFDIIGLGEILIDFTPYENNKDNVTLFGQNAGGAPANLLATVSKYGGKASFIGKVGNDIFGEFLAKTLKEQNVDTSSLVIDHIHNTTLAFVSLNKDGDRDFSFYRRFGADVFLSKEDIKEENIKNSKIFHFGSLSLTDEPAKSATDYAISIAKENSLVVTYDPNYRELLWESEEKAVKIMGDYIKYADILKVSKEEAFMLANTQDIDVAFDTLLSMGPKIVLITDGGNGAYFKNKASKGHVPSFKANTVDTTGAGDIFFGSFIFGIIKDGIKLQNLCDVNLEKYVCTAVYLAGKSTETKGAIASIPNYEEAKLV